MYIKKCVHVDVCAYFFYKKKKYGSFMCVLYIICILTCKHAITVQNMHAYIYIYIQVSLAITRG